MELFLFFFILLTMVGLFYFIDYFENGKYDQKRSYRNAVRPKRPTAKNPPSRKITNAKPPSKVRKKR